MEHRGEAHGREHVEVVAAGGAIRPEAQGHAGGQIRGHRRHAAGQLHVALGVVRDADVAPLEQRNLIVVDPYPVRGEGGRCPKVQVVENGHGPHLVPFLRQANLRLRLGQVDLNRHHQPLG